MLSTTNNADVHQSGRALFAVFISVQKVQREAALNVNITWEESARDDSSLLMVIHASCYCYCFTSLQSKVVAVSFDALWGKVVYHIAQIVFEE